MFYFFIFLIYFVLQISFIGIKEELQSEYQTKIGFCKKYETFTYATCGSALIIHNPWFM